MFVGSKKLTFPTIPCRTSANRCFVVLGWLGYFAVHSARVSLAAKGWWSAFAVAQKARPGRQQRRPHPPLGAQFE